LPGSHCNHSPCQAASYHADPETNTLYTTTTRSCDNITIAPSLLSELEASTDPLLRRLSPDDDASPDARIDQFDRAVFDRLHGADQMAVDKLKQGIEGFAADQVGRRVVVDGA